MARRPGRSRMIASWLVTCLTLAAVLSPAGVHAQGSAASPVVETPAAPSQPTGTAIPSPASPATPVEVSGAAGGGVGNDDGDFDNIGSLTTFKILPELGTIAPGGSTEWVVDFSGLWGLDFSGQPLSLTLQFSWAGTPSDLLCAGEQCSGTPWHSGATTVSQNYSAAYSFGGRLLVTWPNPTALGLYHVYAIMTATSPGEHPIVTTAQKTLNFAVMPSLTPSPSPTVLTGSPVPTEDVGSEPNQTPDASTSTEASVPVSTEVAKPEPTTAQGTGYVLPNTGAHGESRGLSLLAISLLGGALLSLLAGIAMSRRRRRT